MHKITKLILEKRKRIMPLCLFGVFVNLVLSKLWRGEFSSLFSRDYLEGIIGLNIFWYIVHIPMRVWLNIVHNTRYKYIFAYKLDFHVAPIVCLCCIVIVAISVPFVWFLAYPLDIMNFPFIWFMFYMAMNAEADDLEDYFDS